MTNLDFETMFKNEMKTWMGHIPTDEEVESCKEYLEIEPDCDFIKLGTKIINWVKECCVRCDGCGNWFLPEEMMTYEHGFETKKFDESKCVDLYCLMNDCLYDSDTGCIENKK